MLIQVIISLLISLVVSVIAGFVYIPMLRRVKAGQSIREDGPIWHTGKQGTPTIGGIIFISGIVAAVSVMGFVQGQHGDISHLFVLACSLLYGLIGFIDDYKKVKLKQNLGLRVWQKFGLQFLVAVLFIFIMHHYGKISSEVYVPFLNISFQMPVILYYVFAIFVILGTVNSVNITDGIDGLATGVTVPVAVTFVFIALLWGDFSSGIFAGALVGGLVGFLFFNFHPAKVFMGDTGSLFLGGAVCALAFALDIPLLLITLGVVYFVETMSDIIQIGYFKLTNGKRVFKMAPLHHHLEMCGWNEYKIFTVAISISIVFAIISYVGIMGR